MNRVDPLAPAERLQRRRQRRRQPKAAAGAAEALHRRPRPVGRQVEDRPAPRRAARASRRAARSSTSPLSHCALPGGEVGVLERQLGQRRRLALRRRPRRAPPARAAGCRSTSRPRRCGGRRAAARARRGQAQQRGAHQRPRRQVEGRRGLLRRQAAAAPARAPARGSAREVDQRQRERTGAGAITCTGVAADRSRRWCAAPRGGGRSRRAPPPGPATSSRPRAQARRLGCCRGAPRLELVEEPEPLLGERQRQAASSVRGAGPRRGAARPPPPPGSRLDRARRGRPAVGRSNRRAQRQLDPERLPHPRHHLRRQQRVPAEVEEVVLAPHRAAPPGPRDQIAASTSSTGVRGAASLAASAPHSGAGSAWRSSLPFAVTGSGVEDHEGRRAPCTPAAPRRRPSRSSRGRRAPPARLRHHVGHQPLVPRLVLARQHHRLAHPGWRASATSISPSSMR